jgi:hypothetical protein
LLLGALGHKILEPITVKSIEAAGSDSAAVINIALKRKGVTASGHLTDEGLIVLCGSQVTTNAQSSLSDGYSMLRQKLIDTGVLELNGNIYIFTKEYLFRSPSAAASINCGHACTGRDYWHDENGKTLNQIEVGESTGIG